MISQWLLEHGSDAQFVLFFSLFGLFAGAEILIPKRRRSPHSSGRWRTNLLLTALNVGVLSTLPIHLIGVAIWAQNRQVGVLNHINVPMGALIVSTLLVRGLISFATHYLLHKVPWLWRIHRVHHWDIQLDVTSTVRFHPLEFIVTLIPGILVVMLFGLSPWILMLYELLDVSVTLFSHSNIRVPTAIDRVLRYIIVTPDLHRIHHSVDPRETDQNFGAVFPIWDILFGTFRTTSRYPQETMPLGLDTPRDQRIYHLVWLLTSPFKIMPQSNSSPKVH